MKEQKNKKGQTIDLRNLQFSHEIPNHLDAVIYEDGTTNRKDLNEKLKTTTSMKRND